MGLDDVSLTSSGNFGKISFYGEKVNRLRHSSQEELVLTYFLDDSLVMIPEDCLVVPIVS